MSRKLRVGLIFGGRSGEHEISLLSAKSILDSLDRERYEPVLVGIDPDGYWHLSDAARLLPSATPGETLRHDDAETALTIGPGGGRELLCSSSRPGTGPVDVIFPVLHGSYGEDGTVQGLLEMAGVPYVGAGVLGSAVGMDKEVAKRLLGAAGLPVVESIALRSAQSTTAAEVGALVEQSVGFPCFVKPANSGSSVGVSKVKTCQQLHSAVVDAFRYDRKVLIERAIDGREIECAVLGNDEPEASVLGEIVPSGEFYSYQAKYVDENGAALLIPAQVSTEQSELVRKMAVDAFAVLELSGMARVDFLLDRHTDEIYINEVNTIPGFTQISMYPKLWEASGLPYSQLIDRLIECALERHAQRNALSTRYLPDE